MRKMRELPPNEVRIGEDVLDVLRNKLTIEGSRVTFPPVKRELYGKVRDVLVALGGPWEKKAKAHVFPEDPTEAIRETCERGTFVTVADMQKMWAFFKTPDALAEQVVRAAGVHVTSQVLEPSGGDGAILKAMGRVLNGVAPASVITVELNPERAQQLRTLAYPGALTVVEENFLTSFPARPEEVADAIIGNVPFKRGEDAHHILHAYRAWLAPGGMLAIIASAGILFRKTHADEEVRQLAAVNGGYVEVLPPEAFKESGTLVRTVLVVIHKEKNGAPVTLVPRENKLSEEQLVATPVLTTSPSPAAQTPPAPKPEERTALGFKVSATGQTSFL